MIIIPIIIIISVHRSLITIKFSNYNVQCRSDVHTTTWNGDINWIEFQFIIIFQYFRLSMMSKTMRHDVIYYELLVFISLFPKFILNCCESPKCGSKNSFWTITEYTETIFPRIVFVCVHSWIVYELKAKNIFDIT